MREPENLGFEQPVHASNWTVDAYGYDVALDFQVKSEGSASLRIQPSEDPRSTLVRQTVPGSLVREHAVRLTGDIKTRDLSGTATLFVIVNGDSGRIFLDDMRSRPVQGTADWTRGEMFVPRLAAAESVEFGVLVIGRGTAWFDALDIEVLDASAATSDIARAYLEEALDIVEQHSIYRDRVDWPTVRAQAHAAATGAHTTEDTYAAIRYVLFSLGDRHSALIPADRANTVATAGADSELLPDWESPTGVLLDGDIGYVTVPPYIGTDPGRQMRYVDELQGVIEDVDSDAVCGWIVDLRNNHGGSVFPMLAGIGPVLGEGDAGGLITADGELVKRSYMAGQSGRARTSGNPYTLVKAMPPVAVLIGPQTASSGEAVALAFAGRPLARTFGLPTAGYTSGNVPTFLSDGAVLNLASTRMVDRDGNPYGGEIQPDVRVEEDDKPLESQGVVRQAAEWIRQVGNHCDQGG